MGSKHLSKRDSTWVSKARKTGDLAEKTFAELMRLALPCHYVVEKSPSKIILYSNDKGVVLDAKITNTKTGLSIFCEKKSGNAGTGNAHERAGKFLSKRIQERVSAMHDTVADPFFFIFSGKTFTQQNPMGDKYREELREIFYYSNYAILDDDCANYKEIANQIMEII